MIIWGHCIDVGRTAVNGLGITALAGWALLGTFVVPYWRRKDRERRTIRIGHGPVA